MAILAEALGFTTDRRRYVYLSDGGHFDNLGLVEMILRRCHIVVVSDAGCDPRCGFEDLGGGIRKIRIDLGVPIDMETMKIRPPDTSPGANCAVGRIKYSEVDGTNAEDDGWLVYIKRRSEARSRPTSSPTLSVPAGAHHRSVVQRITVRELSPAGALGGRDDRRGRRRGRSHGSGPPRPTARADRSVDPLTR